MCYSCYILCLYLNNWYNYYGSMLYGKAWRGWSYEFNYEYKVVFIGILLLGLIFISLGALISSIVKSDKGAIPISIGIFFVSYF